MTPLIPTENRSRSTGDKTRQEEMDVRFFEEEAVITNIIDL